MAAEEGHDIVVDLLRGAKGTLTIPKKCSFLTFEQNDSNNAITKGLLVGLLDKVIAISSTPVLKNLIAIFPFVKNYFLSKQWSLFLNSTRDFGVIIPESIDDIGSLHENYGLKDLTYIQPEDATTTLQGLAAPANEHYNELIAHFKSIIDINAPQHPTRFYLDGHGLAGTSIASIPLDHIGELLTAFADIDAEFLYINSCQAAGSNLVAMQETLQTIIEKQLKENIRKQLDYELSTRAEATHVPSAETYRSPD